MASSTSPPISTRRPLIVSSLLIALFSLMLVGTSKREDEEPSSQAQQPSSEDEEQPSGAAQEGAAEEQAATIPSSEDWKRTELPEVGVSVRLPPGAKIDRTRAGVDESYAGRYFDVVLASGRDVYISDRVGINPVAIADKAEFYRDGARGFEGYIYRSDDALVARREGAPAGSYCETTACAEAGEVAMCVRSAGATVDGDEVTKLSDAECLQVVAIVRSIEVLE